MDNQENVENIEEFAAQNLDQDDKLRIVKGLLLIFLFSGVVVSSMVYYNAPNYNPNLVFESAHNEEIKHDIHLHENPVYRLQSRYSSKNFIQLELKLERIGKNKIVDSETIRNLRLTIKFAKNKANIQISNSEGLSEFEIPNNLFDSGDLELEKDGKIDNLSESNIGLHVVNHPFSFYLYRKDTGEKLFDTTHSRESSEANHYLYYAKNYMQISTRLPKGHFTYGLGERFTSLRLKKGKYIMWNSDPFAGEPVDKDSLTKAYSSIPSYITINTETSNSYGAYMLNSSPMEVLLEEEYLTFKMTSGVINLYVFSGQRPREVIVQIQKTFGMPFLPPFSALNWHANLISNQPSRDLIALNNTIFDKNNQKSLFNYTFQDLWIDYSLPVDSTTYKDIQKSLDGLLSNGYKVHIYKRSPFSKASPLFEEAKNRTVCIMNEKGEIQYGRTSYGEVCFVDYMAPNALNHVKHDYITSPNLQYNPDQITLLMNEPSQNCDGDCKGVKSTENLPYMPGGDKNFNLEEGTISLSSVQNGQAKNKMINTHNLYSLQETKTYYTALVDSAIERPLIFSRSVFFGNQQYSGKWLGYLVNSWKGLKMAIIQTLNFNMFGNPNVIHEACGFSRFSPVPSQKIKEKEKDTNFTEELCVRWIQFISVNPFARINDFELIPYFTESNRKAIEEAFYLREVLNVYIYGYMIFNAVEDGGSFIRPMFIDFKTQNMKKDLHEIDSQMLIGSHIMASPVITYNERKKKTYFPEDKFYNFYDGKLMNVNGEGYLSVDAPIDKMPLFLRAGFIVPIQIPPTKIVRNLNEMRKLPLELVIGLDQNYRSTGTVIIDDGFTNKTLKEKEYFKLDITSLQDPISKFIYLIFYKLDGEFSIPEGEYPYISKLHIFGLSKKPIRAYFEKKTSNQLVKDIPNDSITINKDTKAVYISNLNISLNKETNCKITFELS